MYINYSYLTTYITTHKKVIIKKICDYILSLYSKCIYEDVIKINVLFFVFVLRLQKDKDRKTKKRANIFIIVFRNTIIIF